MVCEHLQALEDAITAAGITETLRGAAWSRNCREWVYFDCVLDGVRIVERFRFDACVEQHVNEDPRSGREAGFVCTDCHDAVMGVHPADGAGKTVFS